MRPCCLKHVEISAADVNYCFSVTLHGGLLSVAVQASLFFVPRVSSYSWRGELTNTWALSQIRLRHQSQPRRKETRRTLTQPT